MYGVPNINVVTPKTTLIMPSINKKDLKCLKDTFINAGLDWIVRDMIRPIIIIPVVTIWYAFIPSDRMNDTSKVFVAVAISVVNADPTKIG